MVFGGWGGGHSIKMGIMLEEDGFDICMGML